MKKLILTAVCALCTASLYAAQKPDLGSADFASQVNTVSAAVLAAPAVFPAPVPAKARTGQYVQVSGYVNLNGSGFMPQNGGFTSLWLTGWATFRDSTGKITSSNTYLNIPASMWLYPNQYASQTVWPNVYAQFSRDGKPVGSTSMTGSISVSGWPSSNYVTLNGSGNLTGSIYVEDAQ